MMEENEIKEYYGLLLSACKAGSAAQREVAYRDMRRMLENLCRSQLVESSLADDRLGGTHQLCSQ